MIASNILKNALSIRTGLKLETLLFLSVPLLIEETAATFAVSGNMPLDRLSLMVLVSVPYKLFAKSFISFGGILSTPVGILILDYFRRNDT